MTTSYRAGLVSWVRLYLYNVDSSLLPAVMLYAIEAKVV
jgi:hypothetical protein